MYEILKCEEQPKKTKKYNMIPPIFPVDFSYFPFSCFSFALSFTLLFLARKWRIID